MRAIIVISLSFVFLTQAFAVDEKMNYIETVKETILPFYQTSGEQISFQGSNNTQLSAIKFINPNAKETIVLLPGWSESYAKYLEVIYDLYQEGYSIYALDHRGQGFSKHLVESNSQISYVEKFDYYLNDLAIFMNTIVLKEVSEKPYLLAHSMGGAISLLYLKDHQDQFKAAVLCSPMLQINTKPYPTVVANGLIGVLKLLGKGKNYAPGKGDYNPDASFEKNILTHSKVRYQMSHMMNFIYPETIIGGPSVNWIFESVKATKKLKKVGAELKLPILMFQASADEIVKTKRQGKLCKRAADCRIEVFEGAHHEILMEQDTHRDRAMSEIKSFFK